MEIFASIGFLAVAGSLAFGLVKCDQFFNEKEKSCITKKESCKPLCAPYHVAYVSAKGCVCDMTKKDYEEKK